VAVHAPSEQGEYILSSDLVVEVQIKPPLTLFFFSAKYCPPFPLCEFATNGSWYGISLCKSNWPQRDPPLLLVSRSFLDLLFFSDSFFPRILAASRALIFGYSVRSWWSSSSELLLFLGCACSPAPVPLFCERIFVSSPSPP